jgi:hypothetical protein
MNSIRKAAALVIALTITLTGATLATAPLALAGSRSLALHRLSAVAQIVACNTCAPAVGRADRC